MRESERGGGVKWQKYSSIHFTLTARTQRSATNKMMEFNRNFMFYSTTKWQKQKMKKKSTKVFPSATNRIKPARIFSEVVVTFVPQRLFLHSSVTLMLLMHQTSRSHQLSQERSADGKRGKLSEGYSRKLFLFAHAELGMANVVLCGFVFHLFRLEKQSWRGLPGCFLSYVHANRVWWMANNAVGSPPAIFLLCVKLKMAILCLSLHNIGSEKFYDVFGEVCNSFFAYAWLDILFSVANEKSFTTEKPFMMTFASPFVFFLKPLED